MSAENEPTVNLAMTRRQKLFVVLGIVGTAILSTIATDIYGGAKETLSVAFGVSPSGNQGSIRITITPESRIRDDHRFVGMGHTHFITKYSIRLESTVHAGPDRVAVQVNAPGGAITGLMIPPLLRAKLANGTLISEWNGVGHGDDPSQLVFDMDHPPLGTVVMIPLFVESMSDFFRDENLEIAVNFQSGFEKVKCATVKWTKSR